MNDTLTLDRSTMSVSDTIDGLPMSASTTKLDHDVLEGLLTRFLADPSHPNAQRRRALDLIAYLTRIRIEETRKLLAHALKKP